MLILDNISYTHPNKGLLFNNINLVVQPGTKTALAGNNGTGKTTLLRIIAGDLQPTGGQITRREKPYYIPQLLGQYDHLSIAAAMGIETRLNALKEILSGNVSDSNYSLLNDDWTIEERCNDALQHWQLNGFDLSRKMATLSGGQKAKVFLAGINIHEPQLVLMDEPSNHLDIAGREILYDFIRNTKVTLLVVSHDRKLLNLLDTVCELSAEGITMYGGNYDFYKAQKHVEQEALAQDIQNREKALRKAREKERASIERQQKLDSRGKAKQEKAGVARIMMNTLRNKAENSTSKLKQVHAEKTAVLSKELKELRTSLPGIDTMKFGLDDAQMHKGKILFSAGRVNLAYHGQPLWRESIDLEIRSGDRIVIKGNNGSGKTSLLKLISGQLESLTGNVYRAFSKRVYIDQDYSMLDNNLSVYQQVMQFNTSGLQEHELKIMLHRFLFTRVDWDKYCRVLSGGERMRLLICCLCISSKSPDLVILDEPTNNIDIQNVEILTAAINQYQGTLVVVSHDEMFLEQVGVERVVVLDGREGGRKV